MQNALQAHGSASNIPGIIHLTAESQKVPERASAHYSHMHVVIVESPGDVRAYTYACTIHAPL